MYYKLLLKNEYLKYQFCFSHSPFLLELLNLSIAYLFGEMQKIDSLNDSKFRKYLSILEFFNKQVIE